MPRSACTRVSVDLPLDPELAQYRGGDFLDRLGRRVDAVNAFAAHQVLGLFDFVAAVVERRIAAVRPALFADLMQALRGNGQAEELGLLWTKGFRQLAAVEILRDERVVGRLHAELQREI